MVYSPPRASGTEAGSQDRFSDDWYRTEVLNERKSMKGFIGIAIDVFLILYGLAAAVAGLYVVIARPVLSQETLTAVIGTALVVGGLGYFDSRMDRVTREW